MTPLWLFPKISGLYNQTVSVMNEEFATNYPIVLYAFGEPVKHTPGKIN